MTENTKLFSAFEPVNRDEWKNTAIKDLKGVDFDKKLVWKTDEGINVQPFYTKEDIDNIPTHSYQPFRGARKWANFIEVDAGGAAEANRFINKMIAFDIGGVLLIIDDPGKTDFNILLKDINPEKIQIAFRLKKPSSRLIEKYFTYLSARNVSLSAIKGFVQSDILEEWSLTGQEPDFSLLAEQLKISAKAENFKGLMLSSHSFVNAGSGIVQELAFTLNKLTDTIDNLERSGLEKETIIGELAFHFAIGGDYFFEIAKLRAFVPLLRSVLECYMATTACAPLLSSNSMWSKSLYDPNMNMLRNTTEAMSAILGGCDAILINPHDSTYKQPDEFSHRIALNISNLLKEESYLDKVSDPAAGSYYIENISSAIAGKALDLFKEIELNGGYIENFRKGLIQEKIEVIKNRKEAAIATRKKVYVGTNRYPNLREKIGLSQFPEHDAGTAMFPLLQPQRAVQNFEWLRQITQQEAEVTDRVPRVWLACFGNPSMWKARASFSSEFFGTAGFEIMGEYFFQDVKKAAEDSAASDADVVVMCASDADYTEGAKRFAETFRQINRHKKLIVAGNPNELMDSLREAGVDDFIHIKTDVIEFMSVLQGELFAIL